MDEALDLLADEGWMSTRCASAPFRSAPEVADFVARHEQVFVVEQNRDAQMRTLLMTDLDLEPAQFVSILHFDGTPITARFIVREIAAPVQAPGPAQA